MVKGGFNMAIMIFFFALVFLFMIAKVFDDNDKGGMY